MHYVMCVDRPVWAVLQLPPPQWFHRESCSILSGSHRVQPISTTHSQPHSYPRFCGCLWEFLGCWCCQVWWTWCQGLGSLDGRLKIAKDTSLYSWSEILILTSVQTSVLYNYRMYTMSLSGFHHNEKHLCEIYSKMCISVCYFAGTHKKLCQHACSLVDFEVKTLNL